MSKVPEGRYLMIAAKILREMAEEGFTDREIKQAVTKELRRRLAVTRNLGDGHSLRIAVAMGSLVGVKE